MIVLEDFIGKNSTFLNARDQPFYEDDFLRTLTQDFPPYEVIGEIHWELMRKGRAQVLYELTSTSQEDCRRRMLYNTLLLKKWQPFIARTAQDKESAYIGLAQEHLHKHLQEGVTIYLPSFKFIEHLQNLTRQA